MPKKSKIKILSNKKNDQYLLQKAASGNRHSEAFLKWSGFSLSLIAVIFAGYKFFLPDDVDKIERANQYIDSAWDKLGGKMGAVCVLNNTPQNPNNLELARRSLRQAVTIAPNYPRAHAITGIYYLLMGDDSYAKESFELALSLKPENIVAKIGKATVFKHQAMNIKANWKKKDKLLQQAETSLREVKKIKPRNLIEKRAISSVSTDLAVVLFERKKPENAKNELRKYLNNPYVCGLKQLEVWGNILVKIDQIDLGIDFYEKILEKDKRRHSTYDFYGDALLKRKDLNGAVKKYEKAVKYAPDILIYTKQLAVTYSNLAAQENNDKAQKDWSLKAIKIYKKILEKDKTDELIYYNYAIELSRQQNVTKAIKALEKAIELNPNYSRAQDYLKELKEFKYTQDYYFHKNSQLKESAH